MSLILGMDVIPRSVSLKVGPRGQGSQQHEVLRSVCFLLTRLSVTNMEDLKRRILRVIANCNKPKVTAQPGLDAGGSMQSGLQSRPLGPAHWCSHLLLLPWEHSGTA